MTATIQICIANPEVHRLFTRKLENGAQFYAAVQSKVQALSRRAQACQAYALLALYDIRRTVHTQTSAFFDELDRYEGLLEKKKHLALKTLRFQPRFSAEVPFDNAIAADFVELFSVYDRLISMLKVLRTAGCFVCDDDYYSNLRRHFKSINRVLSGTLLKRTKSLPEVTFIDVIDNTESYQNAVPAEGTINHDELYQAIISDVGPRLEESIRKPLLAKLKKPATSI